MLILLQCVYYDEYFFWLKLFKPFTLALKKKLHGTFSKLKRHSSGRR